MIWNVARFATAAYTTHFVLNLITRQKQSFGFLVKFKKAVVPLVASP